VWSSSDAKAPLLDVHKALDESGAGPGRGKLTEAIERADRGGSGGIVVAAGARRRCTAPLLGG
jgi:hypothetical protein